MGLETTFGQARMCDERVECHEATTLSGKDIARKKVPPRNGARDGAAQRANRMEDRTVRIHGIFIVLSAVGCRY